MRTLALFCILLTFLTLSASTTMVDKDEQKDKEIPELLDVKDH